MSRLKPFFLTLILFSGLTTASCGIPRADFENALKKSQRDKEALMTQIMQLENQLKAVRKQLREKENQFDSLFYRYESLSRDYLRLKKSIEPNQTGL